MNLILDQTFKLHATFFFKTAKKGIKSKNYTTIKENTEEVIKNCQRISGL